MGLVRGTHSGENDGGTKSRGRGREIGFPGGDGETENRNDRNGVD